MDRKISKDQQRSTFGEWIFDRRRDISLPQITLFLNFSSRATFYFRNGVIWEHFWWLPVAFSSLQILGSTRSYRTCDHVVILFKRAEWNQWPIKRAKKIPPPLKKRLRLTLTMIVGGETNGVISWVVNFRVLVMLNLCLEGALINYLQPLWCGWYTPAYLSDLYSTGLWTQSNICEAYICTWKRIYCNCQSLYSLLEQIDSFGNLKRKA